MVAVNVVELEGCILTCTQAIEYQCLFACSWRKELMVSVCFFNVMMVVIMVVVVIAVMISVIPMRSVVVVVAMVIVAMSSSSCETALCERKSSSRSKQTSLN